MRKTQMAWKVRSFKGEEPQKDSNWESWQITFREGNGVNSIYLMHITDEQWGHGSLIEDMKIIGCEAGALLASIRLWENKTEYQVLLTKAIDDRTYNH